MPSEEIQNLILKYAKNKKSLDEKEKRKLEEVYLEKLIENKKMMEKNTQIDICKIKKIVTPVSLAPISKERYDELSVLKSLEIFPNIEKVFLLYTKEAETQYIKLKQELEKRKINVVGEKIINELQNVYSYLRGISVKQQISDKDTVLDMTLGMKILGAAIYKIAVERGIKVINWKEEFIMIERENEVFSARNPFETTLEIIQEPILESLKNRENINKCLKTANYSILADYYRNLGKTDCADLFKQIDKTFNFNTLLNLKLNTYSDIEILRNKLYELVTFYSKYDGFEEITKLKMDGFIVFVASFLIELEEYRKKDGNGEDENSYITTLENIIENIKIIPETKSEIEMLVPIFEKNETLEFDEEFKNIFIYFMFKFLKMKTLERGINDAFIEKIVESLNIENDLLEDEKKRKRNNKINIILDFYKEKISNQLLNILDFEDKFLENIEYQVKIENSILKIEKFNLEIDKQDIEIFLIDKNKKIAKKIIDIINSQEKRIKGKNEIAQLLLEKEDRENINNFINSYKNKKINGKNNEIIENDVLGKIYSRYSKQKNSLNKIIKVFNNCVNAKIKQKIKEEKDFIILETKAGEVLIDEIKVNEFYYNLD